MYNWAVESCQFSLLHLQTKSRQIRISVDFNVQLLDGKRLAQTAVLDTILAVKHKVFLYTVISVALTL